MKWTDEAEAALQKVPFFVRRKVRTRIEREASRAGKQVVTPSEVADSRRRFLSGMVADIKGYQVDGCFGSSGCPNRVLRADALFDRVNAILAEADLLGFLKKTVAGDIKFHHEFRVSIAECPNACSQPQIKDIGMIGACVPEIARDACTLCGACAEACGEGAVRLGTADKAVAADIDKGACLGCRRCEGLCPAGAIGKGLSGFRIQLAGKLGRHPRLARELPGLYSEKEACDIVRACIALYKSRSTKGQRFAELFTEQDFEGVVDRFGKR